MRIIGLGHVTKMVSYAFWVNLLQSLLMGKFAVNGQIDKKFVNKKDLTPVGYLSLPPGNIRVYDQTSFFSKQPC